MATISVRATLLGILGAASLASLTHCSSTVAPPGANAATDTGPLDRVVDAGLDARVGAAFGVIADDESRHARLAWEVDLWARQRLSPGERSTVDQGFGDAIEGLRAEVARPIDPAVQYGVGVPGSDDATRLLDLLGERLWATRPWSPTSTPS